MIGVVSYVLLFFRVFAFVNSSHNSREIEQRSEKISWGLSFFFRFVYILDCLLSYL